MIPTVPEEADVNLVLRDLHDSKDWLTWGRLRPWVRKYPDFATDILALGIQWLRDNGVHPEAKALRRRPHPRWLTDLLKRWDDSLLLVEYATMQVMPGMSLKLARNMAMEQTQKLMKKLASWRPSCDLCHIPSPGIYQEETAEGLYACPRCIREGA